MECGPSSNSKCSEIPICCPFLKPESGTEGSNNRLQTMNIENVLFFLRPLNQAHHRAVPFVSLQERCERVPCARLSRRLCEIALRTGFLLKFAVLARFTDAQRDRLVAIVDELRAWMSGPPRSLLDAAPELVRSQSANRPLSARRINRLQIFRIDDRKISERQVELAKGRLRVRRHAGLPAELYSRRTNVGPPSGLPPRGVSSSFVHWSNCVVRLRGPHRGHGADASLAQSDRE